MATLQISLQCSSYFTEGQIQLIFKILGDRMKRLLLLPALILGLSFACDQPYEEIEGFKLGCPYVGNLSAGTVKNDDEKIMVYEQRLENSFFDTAEIEVLEGNIESISLIKIFDNLTTLQKDRATLFESLDEKYGEAVVVGNNESLIIYVNKAPRSESLGSILGMSTFLESAGILKITYASK